MTVEIKYICISLRFEKELFFLEIVIIDNENIIAWHSIYNSIPSLSSSSLSKLTMDSPPNTMYLSIL